MATFSMANLDQWTRKTEARMEAVFRTAAQSMIEEAQTPTDKGGNMRVDTGFLRNSGTAALNSIPTGSALQGQTFRQVDWDAAPSVLVINRAKIGDRIVFGWTANYADVRERKDGFMRLAAQNWPQHVKRAAAKVRKEVTK